MITGDTITIGGSSDDSRISDTDISNWNTAYGWGDHGAQGYYSGDVTLNCVAGLDVTNTSSTALEIYQPTAQADAMMAFHVSGDYAVNFGLDGSTNKLSVGGWSMGNSVYEIYHSGNPQTSITGNAATATTFSTTRANYKGVTDGAVAGQLMWKNYGNGHTIFDASQGTSPDGGAVNNTNSAAAWGATYPTLMGWNGAQTYGVRVDSARVSDSCSGNAATATSVNGITSPMSTNTSQNVTDHKEFQDNVQLRFGNDADVRMDWRGSDFYCRSYSHGGRLLFHR